MNVLSPVKIAMDARRISRREMLWLLGAGAVAAACQTTGAGGTKTPEAGLFHIPNPTVDLPPGSVNFHVVDSGDRKSIFFKKFAQAYAQMHPNVNVDYQGLTWNDIAQVVPLGVRNGSAPDMFQVSPNVPGFLPVQQGWAAPLDDLIPDFAAWKKRFPPLTFLPGVTDFGGKTYRFPMTSGRRTNTLLLYNVSYLRAAGYDPASKRMSWDDFRAAAKKITEHGKGQYYGLIIGGSQTGQLAQFVSELARMSGAAAGSDQMNYKTGEYNFMAPEYLAAVELLLGMKSDGSVFPGSASIDAPAARARMPQGAAAMILQGAWNIPQWEEQNTDFDFGVAAEPVADPGKALPLTVDPGGVNPYWVYANTPHRAVAGDICSYMGSEDGQTAWASLVGIGDISIFPAAQRHARISARSRQAATLLDEIVRIGPSPVVRSPELEKVMLELKPVQPDMGQVVQGIFTGQLSDYRKAMQDLKDRSEKELDRAIKAAQEKGAKVSRQAWVFRNWVPNHDYAESDYGAS